MKTPSYQKRLFSIFTIMLSVLLLTFWACRKEKPELTLPEADPCELDKPVEASFWIGASVSKRHLLSPCSTGSFGDTIIPINYTEFNHGAALTFTADAECYDELKWIIGYEPQPRYGKQIYLEFKSEDVAGTSLPITLIAKKKPNLLCYPDDDGVDTVVKMISFAPTTFNIQFTGHFHGNNIGDDPNDAFTVWIKGHTDTISPKNEDIVGLPRGCNYNCNGYPYVNWYVLTGRMLSFCGKNSVNGTFWDCPGTGVCPRMQGLIEYSPDFDTITIKYNYASDPTLPNEGNNSIHKVFVGVRQ